MILICFISLSVFGQVNLEHDLENCQLDSCDLKHRTIISEWNDSKSLKLKTTKITEGLTWAMETMSPERIKVIYEIYDSTDNRLEKRTSILRVRGDATTIIKLQSIKLTSNGYDVYTVPTFFGSASVRHYNFEGRLIEKEPIDDYEARRTINRSIARSD